MADYGPSIKAARLFEKKSEKSGATYFTGRLGFMKVVLVKAKEPAEDGTPIWNLLLSEAPQKDASARNGSEAPQTRQDYAKPPQTNVSTKPTNSFTDEIPF